VEPLCSHIQKQNLEIWLPGRDVAIDEFLVRFQGRSSNITTIPSKPTPTGYKGWAIAQVSAYYCSYNNNAN
jgi:hypothetical protein